MSYRGPGAGEAPNSCGPGRVAQELGWVCLPGAPGGHRWGGLTWLDL